MISRIALTLNPETSVFAENGVANETARILHALADALETKQYVGDCGLYDAKGDLAGSFHVERTESKKLGLKEPNDDEEPFTASDMDVVTKAFGLRFVTGGNPEGLVELYVEDDELFHYTTNFNHAWLPDLIGGLEEARSLFPIPPTTKIDAK